MYRLHSYSGKEDRHRVLQAPWQQRNILHGRMGKERPVPLESHNNDPAPGDEVQGF